MPLTCWKPRKNRPKRIAKIVVVACRDGIGVACSRFERRIKVRFQHYLNMIEMCLMKQYRFLDAAQSLATTAQRYGWQTDLVNFASRRMRRISALTLLGCLHRAGGRANCSGLSSM